MKKNLAKFLLLSSLVGGMAIAHPVSATTKGAIYEYRNGNLDLVQQPSYEDYESDKLVLKLKTGRVDVVGAREGKKESAHDAGAYQFSLIYKSESGEEETVAQGQNTENGTIQFSDLDLSMYRSGIIKLYIHKRQWMMVVLNSWIMGKVK